MVVRGDRRTSRNGIVCGSSDSSEPPWARYTDHSLQLSVHRSAGAHSAYSGPQAFSGLPTLPVTWECWGQDQGQGQPGRERAMVARRGLKAHTRRMVVRGRPVRSACRVAKKSRLSYPQ